MALVTAKLISLAGGGILRSLAMPMIAAALILAGVIALKVMANAEGYGYSQAEAHRLADINTGAAKTIESLQENVELSNALVDEYRNDSEQRQAREVALLKRIDNLNLPDNENYCRPDCIDLLPVD